MVVLKKVKYVGYQARNLQYKIEDRLDKKLAIDIMKEPSVTLVLEPITRINEQLDKGQYFFSDVIKEGVLLYDTGEFTLSPVREEIPWKERKAIAQEEYEDWFESGVEFLIAVNMLLEKMMLKKAAFLLHQATESSTMLFYWCSPAISQKLTIYWIFQRKLEITIMTCLRYSRLKRNSKKTALPCSKMLISRPDMTNTIKLPKNSCVILLAE